MQDKHLFEYAVIRIVPRVEREEFLNVGVIVYCSAQKFLKTKFELNEQRLLALCGECDVKTLQTYLEAFSKISVGGKDSGPIGALPIASRFRWLTATKSTIVQTSKVHSGFCDAGEKMLEHLFDQLVAL